MSKLCCRDYGYECDFVAEGLKAITVIEKFRDHSTQEHGIEYSEVILAKFILRQKA